MRSVVLLAHSRAIRVVIDGRESHAARRIDEVHILEDVVLNGASRHRATVIKVPWLIIAKLVVILKDIVIDERCAERISWLKRNQCTAGMVINVAVELESGGAAEIEEDAIIR